MRFKTGSTRSLWRKRKLQVAVFCSGFGSNLQALLNAEKRGNLKSEIGLVVCDRPEAEAIARANRAKKPVFLIEPKYFGSRMAFEKAIEKVLLKKGIGLVVLAGFMRILSPYFTKRFRRKILNVHPALLPSFKGARAIRDAFEYGVKVTGVTVHFVTDELDNGPVILQDVVSIAPNDSLKTLEKKIHRLEHQLYPRAVRLFAEGRLKYEGRRVKNK